LPFHHSVNGGARGLGGRRRLALAASVSLGLALGLTAASCELVLGDLPPVHDAGTGGRSPGTTGGSGGSRATASATATATSSGSGGGSGGAITTSSTSSTVSTSSTASSAATASASASSSSGCCDCDGDTYRSQALCGADDCDDHDPLVHPGQSMYFATPSPNPDVGWDYDCNGKPDPEFPTPVNCGLISGSCDAGVGFLNSVPPCGDAGSWGSCVPGSLPLTCMSHVIDANKVARCK
jgi:hypothetical protein